jgi:hypothetical protein
MYSIINHVNNFKNNKAAQSSTSYSRLVQDGDQQPIACPQIQKRRSRHSGTALDCFKSILSTYRQLASRLAELLNRVCDGRRRKDLAQQVELALHRLLVSHQLISTKLQVLDEWSQFKVLVLICDS